MCQHGKVSLVEVRLLPEARAELRSLPTHERAAMITALRKLEAGGTPHTSQVKGSGLRELRPRRGSSPWRALYRRMQDTLVVAAIAPEATVSRRRFALAVKQAENRLMLIEEEQT